MKITVVVGHGDARFKHKKKLILLHFDKWSSISPHKLA